MRRNKRLLVTGGSGYFGQHLVAYAADEGHVSYTYFSHDRLQRPGGYFLDLRDRTAVNTLVRELHQDVIIHTAGSESSQDPDKVIRSGAKNIADVAHEGGIRLIHMSTDVIFDGRSAPYDESRSPSPLHTYGRSKAAAEAIVSGNDNHVIIRTSLIYGLDIMDRGTQRMVETLANGQAYTLFTDQRRNPVWVETLSRACLELVGSDYVGFLNVAGRQVLSRAELGLRLLDWWNVTDRTNLTAGTSDGDRWPQDLELDLRRATDVLETPLLGVDEVLSQAKRRW
jgi:dTDP-4-dehydrorhamnose reductase